MRMLRCRICGETHLGTQAPTRCPFCGADESYFVEPGGFASSENEITLTDVERADLAHAIELERSNTRYYLALATLGGNETLSSAFKRLARIEAEHCSVFCKLAGVAKPDDLAIADTGPATWCEGIAESSRRETRASALYAQFASRATSPRLVEVFSAVARVETDHLAIDALAARYAECDGAV